MMKELILGSRGSDLALYQANLIKSNLEKKHECKVSLKIIKTSGDKIDNMSFDKMEGKGFFTKELEDALLNREIDLAVHSLKDLMTSQPDGLKLGAVGFRADRRELLLIRPESRYGDNFLPVKENGIIGTGSARRKCQIALLAPSLKINDLRGNVLTRINKLRDGQYDAIIVAAAGVQRLELDLSDLETVMLEPDQFLPAPAQGILGIQIRDNDPEVEKHISGLANEKDATEAALERGLLACFDAGCSLPLGVHSQVDKGNLNLNAILGIRDNNDHWIDFRRINISGSDIKQIVDEAYSKLKNFTGIENV